MNILVIARTIIDTNTTPQINIANSLDLQHAKLNINSYDERAVIEAVKYKKQFVPTATIYVCGIGNNSENIIRTAIARGADEGIQIIVEDTDDDLKIAKYIKSAIIDNLIPFPDVIFLGVESTNTNNIFLPTMLSKLLKFKNIFNISKIEYLDNEAVAFNVQDMQYNISLQSIISFAHIINTPGFLKLPDIMAAKKKVINKISLSTVSSNAINIEKAYYPENTRQCKYLNYEELLNLLKLVGE